MAKGLIALMGMSLMLLVTVACTAGGATPLSHRPAGVLTGSVTIGPLCSVQPCTQPLGDVYSSRELLLRRQGRETIRMLLEADGSFSAVVPAGRYTVEVTECDFLGCPGVLPVTVTVASGETTTLHIDIDTGIRGPVPSGHAGADKNGHI